MQQGQPNPVAERLFALVADIFIGAVFMTPMVLIAFYINIHAFKALSVPLPVFWMIDSSNVTTMAILFAAVIGIIGLSTHRMGWWHTHTRAGLSISTKARNTYRLRLYALMTTALTLTFTLVLVSNSLFQ